MIGGGWDEEAMQEALVNAGMSWRLRWVSWSKFPAHGSGLKIVRL